MIYGVAVICMRVISSKSGTQHSRVGAPLCVRPCAGLWIQVFNGVTTFYESIKFYSMEWANHLEYKTLSVCMKKH